MNDIFVVLGYGIPKDILQDRNYNTYLSIVFNTIYDLTITKKIQNPKIVFCGGKTDIFSPYNRTEAREIKKLFEVLANNPAVKEISSRWELLLEETSLSTLENILNVKTLMREKNINSGKLFFSCDYTRQNKIKVFVEAILPERKTEIIAIDFDTSANRYINPEILSKKEQASLEYCLKALDDPEELKRHHETVANKVIMLRESGEKNQSKVLEKWWQEMSTEYLDKQSDN